MTIDQIYQDGRHYDRLFRSPRPLPAFWFEVADEYGDPILELACGTGRIAIPLAERGHRVTGIDLSEPMLNEARRKSASAGVEIDWRLGDIRVFDLGRRFRLAILANNALCHLHTLADFEAWMATVRQHLVQQGRLIVEVFVPNLAMLLLTEETSQALGAYEDPDGAGQVVVTQRAHYDPVTQIRYVNTATQHPGQAAVVTGTLNLRMYFPQELDALFKYNGFTIQHKYGGFDRQPFAADPTTQLFILTKR